MVQKALVPAGPSSNDLVAAGGSYAALWRSWHGDSSLMA